MCWRARAGSAVRFDGQCGLAVLCFLMDSVGSMVTLRQSQLCILCLLPGASCPVGPSVQETPGRRQKQLLLMLGAAHFKCGGDRGFPRCVPSRYSMPQCWVVVCCAAAAW